jgi:hypothetical protein
LETIPVFGKYAKASPRSTQTTMFSASNVDIVALAPAIDAPTRMKSHGKLIHYK